MKKNSGGKKTAGERQQKPPRARRFVTLAVSTIGIGALLGALIWLYTRRSGVIETYVPRPRGQLTFNKDIAPIVFQHCAGCHRPGQSAPFALLSYQDVKKHAADIVTVTARRYMPPWLPEHGYGEFAGERRLSVTHIGMIQQWVAEGAGEGAASDLPAPPQWTSEWQLGQPDMVLSMAQPYQLAAEGRDVYRNFVIPVPAGAVRYVRGVELRPGNPQVVHHAFVKVDRTPQSRRLDALDDEPGFAGMGSPAEMPDGHFLGWQPGRRPVLMPEGLAWQLTPGSDLVLQLHLNPSGKPEPIQSSVGLYFTDRPPTNTCFKITLTSFVIDISPGAQDYVVQDSYVLPVDVQVLAVLPHAHYLAKEMQGWATLPNGSKQWLLWIKQWDFQWLGDYRYARPVLLPKGTALSMRFTYDNSTNNVRKPVRSPATVTYGSQSTDEMAELWFQLLPRNSEELTLLARDYQMKLTRTFIAYDEYALRKNPNDAEAHDELGMMLLNQNKSVAAERHFRAALRIKPDFARAHYDLGVLLRQQGRAADARMEFETVLRLDPDDFKAHGNLGFIFLDQGDRASAQAHFENALRLNPDDALARSGLLQALKPGGSPGKRK